MKTPKPTIPPNVNTCKPKTSR